MESLLGAIYLDQGLEVAKGFVHKFLIQVRIEISLDFHRVQTSAVRPEFVTLNPKSFYQHLLQCMGLGMPTYKLWAKTRTLYGWVFEMGVFVQVGNFVGIRFLSVKDKLVCSAEGATKKEAGHKVAQLAIQNYLKVDRYMS